MSSSESKPYTNLAIEKEKTRRLKIKLTFFVLLSLAGITGILIATKNGKIGEFKVDITKGEFLFKIDQPIVNQSNIPTSTFNDDNQTISYTTGELSEKIIKKIEEKTEEINPYKFTGKNYINKTAGYLLTVNQPDKWNLNYNPSGLTNPVIPINTISYHDGTHLNINKEVLVEEMPLKDYVNLSINGLMSRGMISQPPAVSYDEKSKTAFLRFENEMTNGVSYMKIILNKNIAYLASANYNTLISEKETINNLISMITSFTLIN